MAHTRFNILTPCPVSNLLMLHWRPCFGGKATVGAAFCASSEQQLAQNCRLAVISHRSFHRNYKSYRSLRATHWTKTPNIIRARSDWWTSACAPCVYIASVFASEFLLLTSKTLQGYSCRKLLPSVEVYALVLSRDPRQSSLIRKLVSEAAASDQAATLELQPWQCSSFRSMAPQSKSNDLNNPNLSGRNSLLSYASEQ